MRDTGVPGKPSYLQTSSYDVDALGWALKRGTEILASRMSLHEPLPRFPSSPWPLVLSLGILLTLAALSSPQITRPSALTATALPAGGPPIVVVTWGPRGAAVWQQCLVAQTLIFQADPSTNQAQAFVLHQPRTVGVEKNWPRSSYSIWLLW